MRCSTVLQQALAITARSDVNPMLHQDLDLKSRETKVCSDCH